ncbi:hypothetical protein AVEN_52231-1 [Araneus ventricosus]|uniref:Uncharacterized protein n=1 Tax=Araneus ventricosus TaxID=182803 RepID=A0A4Y2P8N9_ARAVE|nr:hypothetical protein AVEN_150727-1 [Araneus ventricosus]GBN47409.1 hypothetical protein AVEN_108065-1 [Araneus ventricosus]GBN47435.1 hypothetical protein AVEN_106540-1 [Araneus ventricosus]GBN47593.1 hypothetical protein AVEN_52231-1 [Araneus ventricosus]
MFTLPALLYLKLLPLFGQCLFHFFFIVPNKSRPPHAGGGLPTGPLPTLHPFWVGRASVGIFTPRQGRTFDPRRQIKCAPGPNRLWIFGGIEFSHCPAVPCPFNRFGCCNGNMHGAWGDVLS